MPWRSTGPRVMEVMTNKRNDPRFPFLPRRKHGTINSLDVRYRTRLGIGPVIFIWIWTIVCHGVLVGTVIAVRTTMHPLRPLPTFWNRCAKVGFVSCKPICKTSDKLFQRSFFMMSGMYLCPRRFTCRSTTLIPLSNLCGRL